MRGLEQARRAGGPDGQAAHHGVEEVERLAALVLEQCGRRGQRRGFATVERGQLPRLSVVPDEEGATPQARALRLHETQNRLRGDHPVFGFDRSACRLGLHRGAGGLGQSGDLTRGGALGRDGVGGLLRQQRYRGQQEWNSGHEP